MNIAVAGQPPVPRFFRRPENEWGASAIQDHHRVTGFDIIWPDADEASRRDEERPPAEGVVTQFSVAVGVSVVRLETNPSFLLLYATNLGK